MESSLYVYFNILLSQSWNRLKNAKPVRCGRLKNAKPVRSGRLKNAKPVRSGRLKNAKPVRSGRLKNPTGPVRPENGRLKSHV